MTVPVAKPGSIRLVALASFVGTTIEWYDFFLYGTAAALVLNKLFFPTFDPLMGTLAALATYSVGFVARPIGGIVIGHYGDKIGRKSMLVLTLVIMGVATFLIGCLPTYAQIGPWAAVLLVILRIAQGFGVGGEWGGAVLMAIEHAPPGKRGFYGSWPQIGVPAGSAAGEPASSRDSPGCRKRIFSAWGWRVPFLLSIFLVGVGLVIRLAHPRDARVREDEGNAAATHSSRSSKCSPSTRKRCCSRWARGSRRTARSTSTASSSSSTRRRSVGMAQSSCSTGFCSRRRCELAAIPLYGALSDRVGRRPVYLFGAISTAVLAYPLFLALDTGSTPLVWTMIVLSFLCAHAAMYAPAGGVPVGAVRDARALQRRVAGRAAVVGAGGRAVPAHRRRRCCSSATAAARCRST